MAKTPRKKGTKASAGRRPKGQEPKPTWWNDYKLTLPSVPHSLRKDYRGKLQENIDPEFALKQIRSEAANRTPDEVAEDKWADRPADAITPVGPEVCREILLPGAYWKWGRTAATAGLHDHIPKPSLPIDVFVSEMLAGEPGRGTLMPTHLGREIGDLCHEARRAVFLAASQAALAADEEQHLRKQDAKREDIQNRAEKISGELAELLERLERGIPIQESARGTGRVVDEALNRQRADGRRWRDAFHRAHVAALEIAQFQADQRALHKPTVPNENAWAMGFADQLGYIWCEWTGDSSSKKSPAFIRFVEAAYKSVNPRPGKYSFEHQVQRARKIALKRKEWDGYDRFIKDNWPPEPSSTIEPRRSGASGDKAGRRRPIAKSWS